MLRVGLFVCSLCVCVCVVVVVARRALGHIPSELRDLDLSLELALEAREEDLALPGLEPVHQRRDRPHVVHHGKVDELLVDKVAVGDGRDVTHKADT